MKFYYLKLGKSNKHAIDWLDKHDNPLKRPAIVIFFGRSTRENPRAGESGQQIKAFYESADLANRSNRLIVVVGKGVVWILQPDGEVVEAEDTGRLNEDDNLLKMMPVKILKRLAAKDVPHVLASINANTFLVQGTFREIKPWGNQKAICHLAGINFPQEHWRLDDFSARQLLECLSSVELETLVARVFEAAGCFVPAHRGGMMSDIDLFAHNDSSMDIHLDELCVPAGKSVSIQVKGSNAPSECPDEIDCLIAFDVERKPKCFDGEWLLKQVIKFPMVKAWLRRSLNWLPEKMLNPYGI